MGLKVWKTWALGGLSSLLFSGLAMAQSANPSGFWHCIMNNGIVTIDVQVSVVPNQSLQFQGGIYYVNTGRSFAVRGPGRWSLSPADQNYPGGLFTFQMQPMDGNHAIFSIFVAPTGDPNFLGNRFVNPQTGGTTDTRCQRIG